MNYTAAVITVSDKASQGLRWDTSGPAVCTLLAEHGWQVVFTAVVPDEMEKITQILKVCSDEKDISLILTTGGTGFSPRDITPEATLAVADRLAPGIAEAIRAESLKITPRAMLSRAASVIRGKTLIVNLPGSVKACSESMDVFLNQMPHAIEILRNVPQDCGMPAKN